MNVAKGRLAERLERGREQTVCSQAVNLGKLPWTGMWVVVELWAQRPQAERLCFGLAPDSLHLDARQFLALRRATAVSQNKMAAARLIGEHSIMTGCE
jgi:hypothetical protein